MSKPKWNSSFTHDDNLESYSSLRDKHCLYTKGEGFRRNFEKVVGPLSLQALGMVSCLLFGSVLIFSACVYAYMLTRAYAYMLTRAYAYMPTCLHAYCIVHPPLTQPSCSPPHPQVKPNMDLDYSLFSTQRDLKLSTRPASAAAAGRRKPKPVLAKVKYGTSMMKGPQKRRARPGTAPSSRGGFSALPRQGYVGRPLDLKLGNQEVDEFLRKGGGRPGRGMAARLGKGKLTRSCQSCAE